MRGDGIVSWLQWGDVPGWIEALATGAAFGIVAWTLRMQLEDRRQEQASNVDYVLWAAEPDMSGYYTPGLRPAPVPERKWPRMVLGTQPKDFDQVYFRVFNNNKNAINDVIVALPFATRHDRRYVSLGKIPPGEHTCTFLALDPDASGEPMFSLSDLIPLIQFTDQAGRLWQRTVRGSLTAVRKGRELATPANTAQLSP